MRPRSVPALVFILFASLLSARPATAQRKLSVPPLRASMVVSTDWLADHMRDPQVVILHVARNRNDYDVGHIPHARFLALDDLVAIRKGLNNELPPVAKLERVFAQLGVSDTSQVVLYGDLAGLSAARAYWTLDYLGHGDRTALLDGGLEKWRTEERPVTTVAPDAAPAKFTAKVNRHVLTNLPAVRELSRELAAGKASTALIDTHSRRCQPVLAETD